MADNLQTIREYAASLPDGERSSFIDKFNSIKDDDSKISTLAGRISKQPGTSRSTSLMDKIPAPVRFGIQALAGASNTITGGATQAFENWLSQKTGAPGPADPSSAGYKIGGAAGYLPLGAGVEAGLMQAAGKMAPQLLQKTLPMMAGRGALAGGITGAIGTPDNRVEGGVGGGILGGAAAPLLPLASKAIGYGKQLLQADSRLPSTNSLNSAITKLESTQQKIKDQSAILNSSTNLNIRDLAGKKKALAESYSSDIAGVKSAFDKTKENLNSLLTTKIQSKVQSIKAPIITLFKNASTAYGKTLDNIVQALDSNEAGSAIIKKNAPPVTRDEIVSSLKGLIDNADADPLIVKSSAYNKIKGLLDKYAQQSPTGLVDAAGSPLSKDLPQAIDLKQIIGDMRDINSGFRAGVRGGSQAISPDELMIARFNHSLGDLVKERVPAFAELQSSYRPIMQNKELAYQIFKPGNEIKTNMAEAFFKRTANGKATQQDKSLLSFIQSGGLVGKEKLPGLGNVTKDIEDIGNQIAELGKKFNLDKQAREAGQSLDISKLDATIRSLQDRRDLSSITKTGRLTTLSKRLDIIKDALAARKTVNETKRKLLYGGLTAIGGVGVVAKEAHKLLPH